MDADVFFATEWAGLAERIRRTLARHGVAPCDRDDVLQETALRLYRAWPSVDPARGAEAYARTIAVNIVRDNARRPVHAGEVLCDVPDRADAGDVVERTTLARLELGRVRRALASFGPSDQRLLTDAVVREVGGSDRDPVVPAAVRMARMRVRRQLVAMLKTASGLAAFLTGGRRVLRAPRAAAITAVGIAVVVAGTHLQPAHRAPAPREVTLGAVEVGDAANPRDAASPAGGTVRSAAPRAAAPVRVANPRSRTTPKPARKPVRIPLPVGSVTVLARAQAEGVKVEVGERREHVPVCVTTPAGPIDDRIDC